MRVVILLFSFLLLLLPSQVVAAMYTKGGYIACLTYNDFDTAIDALVKKHTAAFDRLIERKRCLLMKPGLPVSIIESNAPLGVEHIRVFLPSGDTINVWTAIEAIEMR